MSPRDLFEMARSAIHRIPGSPVGRRVTWVLLVAFVGLFALGSFGRWLPAGFVGPLGAVATPAGVIPKELLQVFVALTATFVIAFIKRSSISAYGLPARKAFGKDFWNGAGWGFVMLSATIALMAATHSYKLGSIALSRVAIFEYGVSWAAAFLLVSVAEEVAFRGYLQYAVTMRIGFWPASVVTSVFFGFAHRNNSGENWFGLANVAVIGMFACLALRRTGSLWFPIGWHMAFDWGQSFVYSVPDSGALVGGHLFHSSVTGNHWLTGGSVGPEASVFNLVTTLIGIALFAFVYPETRYPQPEHVGGGATDELNPARVPAV